MLPPQLRSSTAVSKYRIGSSNALRASSNVVLRASTAHVQSRSFWKGGHRWDWVSHLDPAYQRYARVRTLKTRAKLLKTLRRRGAFEWDVSTKPFFTPRNLRWASHWRGRQWYTNDDPKEKIREEATAEEEKRADEDGYELSNREKEWRDQMEAMRKRIQQDPYEAVFGKRFEPFWSPLVPSWMREEMGLRGWPKEGMKEADKASAPTRKTGDSLENSATTTLRSKIKEQESNLDTTLKQLRTDLDAQVKSPQAASDPSKPFSRMTGKERVRHINRIIDQQHASGPAQFQPATRPSSYAYASSTSWDSVSNRTKKVEWDSTSNQTKTYEYDPISNRMIEVEAPNKVAIDSDSSAVRQAIGNSKDTSVKAVSEPSKVVDIPVKQSSDIRKSIPIPPPLSQPSHSITLGYTQTAVGPLKSTAVSSASVKPAAIAKLPAQDLDMMTADHVRASMGKVKQMQPDAKATTAEEKAELERDFDSNVSAQDAEVDAILKERAGGKEQTTATSAWDRAELEDILRREVDSLTKKKDKLLKDERGLFHIERQKRELAKLDERLKALVSRLEAIHRAVVQTTKAPTLQTSLQRAEAKKDSPLLQSSVERMQSRDLPKALEQDLDDAAAHESTEPVGAHSSVPKQWTKAADLLQADRVKRTAAKRPFSKTRWVDDMNARKVAYEQRKAETQAAEDAKNAESNARLEKVRKMLETEVAEQKLKMQAFEGRYAQKVNSLRGELDTAFNHSSIYSEKHVQRIRELEVQLSALKDKESKYTVKVKSLRDELERAYKQSAVHAEKHLERIRYLEGELEVATTKPVITGKANPEIVQAEGDICVNAPNFGDNGKWYKRPANPSRPTSAEIEKAVQKTHDKALVEEVQGIYEKRYGTIDENHQQPRVSTEEQALQELQRDLSRSMNDGAGKQQQPKRQSKKAGKAEKRAEEKARQVVEVESDVDLGEELAKYEKENREPYKVEQNLTAPESAEKMKSVLAGSLEQELKMPEPETNATPNVGGVQWADPPLYKVLAYDSGNDMMSSATTTTSVIPGSAEERPLGISEALSLLYQPARFVPYFAKLQSDNFQAIAATREVIVFRQVKKREEPRRPEAGKEFHYSEYMVQEADEKGRFIAQQIEAAEEEDRKANSSDDVQMGRNNTSRVNPIDGTSRRHMGPTTGNFASPTGFVNHDPIFPPEPKEEEEPRNIENDAFSEVRSDTYSTIAKEPTAKTSRQIWESLPGANETPVKRTESVFSGMTRAERQRYSKEQQHRAQERNRLRNLAKKEERMEKRRLKFEQNQRLSGRSARSEEPEETEEFEDPEQPEQSERPTGKTGSNTLKYMLGAGLSTAGVMYLVGALAERERVQGAGNPAVAEREKARQRQLEHEVKRLEDEAARLTREWNRR